MIEHADAALESWFATLEPPVEVAFVRAVGESGDAVGAKQATLALTLHAVREQHDKRDNHIDDVRDFDGRVVARQKATRFFELDYVCSVSGEARAAHRTLGALVQLLVDHDVVPIDHVPAALAALGHPVDIELVPAPLPAAAVTVRLVVPVRPSADRQVGPPAVELHLDMRPPPGAERPTTASPPSDGSGDGVDAVPPIGERKWTTVRRREMIRPGQEG